CRAAPGNGSAGPPAPPGLELGEKWTKKSATGGAWWPASPSREKSLSQGSRPLRACARPRVWLLIGHHELRPVGRGRVVAGVVADVVVARVVVVVQREVDAELCRPGLVDRRQARGVEAPLRPGAVARGARQAPPLGARGRPHGVGPRR